MNMSCRVINVSTDQGWPDILVSLIISANTYQPIYKRDETKFTHYMIMYKTMHGYILRLGYRL